VAGLLAQGALVEAVADETQGEDGDGEGVAAVKGVAAGELGENFVVVLGTGGRVPEEGVEEDRCGGDCEGVVWSVVGGERLGIGPNARHSEGCLKSIRLSMSVRAS